MQTNIYPPLLDSSKKFLKLKKIYRYHLKKISEMDENEIIRACHFYVEENHLGEEWEAFRRNNEKRQYHKEMAAEIAQLPKDRVPRLLLHSCCGPCSTAVLEQLMPHFEIILFYYNPNIAPEGEFYRRLETQKQLLASLNPPHPITLLTPAYDASAFWIAVRGFEDTPEMGVRCEKCIEQRMREAAIAADAENCDYFATTLSVSPHKNAPFINACGAEIAKQHRAKHLPADFKKGGGYARSVALSAEFGLYRQDYCGCPMSLREAEERRAARDKNC